MSTATVSVTHGHDAPAPPEPRFLGAVAEFPSADALVAAAARVHAAGYTRFECHSPFPVHGIDEAAGIRPTILPWLVTVGGVTGLMTGLFLQWYTSSVTLPEAGAASGYPIVISGKPMFAAHAVPVCFELTILLGAFTAFFGMLLLNGLPRFHHPLFSNPRFRRATADKFFIVIEADDPKFSREGTRRFLSDVGAAHVEVWEEPPSDSAIPQPIFMMLAIVTTLALVPPALIAWSRTGTSEFVGLQRVIDKGMVRQPKINPQTESAFFADRRAMRPTVIGTVAQGDGDEDIHSLYGRKALPSPIKTDVAFTSGLLMAASADSYAESLPEEFITDPTGRASEQRLATLMRRGKERYEIHCAACHGLSGNGKGLVHERAARGDNPTWVPPKVLNGAGSDGTYVRDQPDGRIYNTIVYGRNSMQGLGSRIGIEDRWAIVLYLRAMHRANNSRLEELDPEQRKILESLR